MKKKPKDLKKMPYMLFLIPVCILSTLTLVYFLSMDEPLFLPKNLRINGAEALMEKDIMNKVAPFLKENLFRMDAAKMKEAITSHPLVKEVSIKRVFPFSVIIDVTEKKPSALWVNDDGNVLVLDETGAPFRELRKGDEKGMFLINARDKGDAKSLFREVNGWIKAGTIKKDYLSEIAYHEGSITLFGLDSGVEIILGKEDQDKRLKRAMAVFEDAKRRGLLIKCIDARFEKGAIIQERKG
jgi:cell division protein FtsQ